MRQKREPVPYANATSGTAAREEVTRMLRRFGCESVGFMDDFDKHEVLLAFTHRGRQVQLRASAKGWAAMYLKAKPYTGRTRVTLADYQRSALMQGLVAVNSILRDWCKGQLTAVECGMMPFEAVFMPHVILGDGRSVLEHVTAAKMLPAPKG
jgi:hypothetical protein